MTYWLDYKIFSRNGLYQEKHLLDLGDLHHHYQPNKYTVDYSRLLFPGLSDAF
jgi:Zn-dependent membrane protease YugP